MTSPTGQTPPRMRHTGPSRTAPITLRTNSAAVTPLTVAARFISASITENSAIAATVTMTGNRR